MNGLILLIVIICSLGCNSNQPSEVKAKTITQVDVKKVKNKGIENNDMVHQFSMSLYDLHFGMN